MNRVSLLSCSALVACVAAAGTSACAQDIREYNVPAGALGDALQQYATQSDQQLFYSGSLVAGLQTQGLRGRFSSSVRRRNIWRRFGVALTESGPRQGLAFRRRACGAASGDVRWSVS